MHEPAVDGGVTAPGTVSRDGSTDDAQARLSHRRADRHAAVTKTLLLDLFGPVEQRAFAIRLWTGETIAPLHSPVAPLFTLVLNRPSSLRAMLLPTELALGGSAACSGGAASSSIGMSSRTASWFHSAPLHPRLNEQDSRRATSRRFGSTTRGRYGTGLRGSGARGIVRYRWWVKKRRGHGCCTWLLPLRHLHPGASTSFSSCSGGVRMAASFTSHPRAVTSTRRAIRHRQQ